MRLTEFSWIADENIDAEVVEFMRGQGLTVQSIREAEMRGASDAKILETALGAQSVVLRTIAILE